MQAIIQPSRLSGVISAPASKSAMQRACAAALLKGGQTALVNPGISDDDKAALNIIQQLGATVEQKNESILITSDGGVRPVSNQINCGESGLSVRMFTSIAALASRPITINGKGSLLKRPLSFFDEVLPRIGVECQSNDGLLPLRIQGPLRPGNIVVDGSLSSQFLTGLLFAYSGANASDVTVTVNNLNSKPYIDLTLKVMEDFGLKTPENNTYNEFFFPKRSFAEFNHSSFEYTVESDWSGSAFLLVAAAVSGDVVVKGLNFFSTQADRAIIQALRQSGATVNITERQIEIQESKLNAFDFDATDCPDLFPPLVALASYCEGTSVIEGIHRLTHKESNRAMTLQEEFGKMGVEVSFQNDSMLIEGVKAVKGARVSSCHDHRIAMACAVAALKANGEVIIDDAGAVNKSYPQFWEHLQKLNARLTLNHN
jgi:3-phosphoshikimate 1-carboxyvinyltransferase